ncbi:MAG: 3-phosphoshikimate 1-carboxyvinyltransferase, partial [Clostridiales bacterium]|nr:3-phosphoshikimate 1-carboxyvinyltransferase [Clostridiales bacterium]
RKIIAAALSDDDTEIIMNTFSEDILATLNCIKALGGNWNKTENGVNISPIKKRCGAVRLDFCESGSTARFLMPVTMAIYEDAYFSGRGRLGSRPFGEIVREMRSNSVRIDSETLPMHAEGRLTGSEFRLSGDVSSQFTTGLLFTLPLLEGGGKIVLTSPLQSAPYVDMTIDTLSGFGVNVVKGENEFAVKQQRYISPKKTIADGDWSNAAFWIAADKICGNVAVTGLDRKSRQGDKAILEIMDKTELDCSQIPDLVPILAVLAASRKGRTVIKNAARLRMKESDRIKSVTKLINSLGGHAEEKDDGIVIDGTGFLRGGVVDGCGDHRIVMAAAVASCICEEQVVINGADSVNKSYPTFFEDFNALGGAADVQHR